MRRVLRWVAIACGLLAVGMVVWITQASTQVTGNGVPVRWLLPLGQRAISVPVQAASRQPIRIAGFLDGPVVRRQRDGSWHAQWFCEDRAEHRTGRDAVLRIDCAGRDHAFVVAADAPVIEAAAMPARVFAVSDIEGDIAYLEGMLRAVHLVDAAGRWQGGSAHLVVVGDSVDRGRDVFAVLWRLHDLATEAARAGGAVHVLLGNHEQYLLSGIDKDLHAEHRHALARLGGHAAAFAADTLIGAWLRRLPVAVRLGDTLFVHGGVAPGLAVDGGSLAQWNADHRAHWSGAAPQPAKPALAAVLGSEGLTQYRGWMRGSDDGSGGPSTAHVASTLSALGVQRAVVGHSLVPAIQPLHDGRVWAIDVAAVDAAPQVLKFDAGKPVVVDVGVLRHDPRGGNRLRAVTGADAALLYATAANILRAMQRPNPY